MSILIRVMACLGCLVGLSIVTKDLVPTSAARSASDRSVKFLTPCAINAVLLARPDVQCELGIDDLQSEQVHAWLLAIKDHARDYCANPNKMFLNSEQELEAYQQQIRELVQVQLDRSESGLSDVLNVDQLQRLRQLSLQREGMLVFQRPEIIDRLGLTAPQRDLIDELPGLGLSPHAPRYVSNRCRDELSNLFTAKQRQTWQALVGEVFLFDQAMPFGLEEEVLAALTGIPASPH